MVGALIGRKALITFPQSSVCVEYRETGEMHYVSTDARTGAIKADVQPFTYVQVSESIFVLNWIEKSGFMVSQIINAIEGTAHTFCTHKDSKKYRKDKQIEHISCLFKYL